MTRRPPTLFLRLLLLTLPVESFVLALFGIGLVRGVERREAAALDEQLRVQREAVLRGADLDSAGSLRVDSESALRALAPGTFGCLLDGGGAILWESPGGWFQASGLRASSQEVTETLQTLSVEGAWFRVIGAAKRVKKPEDGNVATGPLVEVVLAAPLSGLEKSNRDFRRRAAAAGVALLLLTAALLWGAIWVGLNPVRAIIRRLHGVPGTTGTERLDEGLVPSELRPLAREINSLLERLWGRVQFEKRFTAEAAHELRTPITLVKSTLQTALLAGRSREDPERALQEALEDLQRLERTAESLLILARADALLSMPHPAFEEMDLYPILKAVAERFAADADEKGLEWAFEMTPARVRGERGALERLFTNLVDNAVKYTAPGGTITLRCASTEGEVLAAVEDTGPAIPVEERPHLFQPFFRGAPGRAPGVPGSGLGLSIAATMARLHRAELTHEPGEQGGNRFVLRFPADPT